MKLLVLLFPLLLIPAAVSQAPAQQNLPTTAQVAQVVQKVCRGSEITSGEEFDTFRRAVQKLAPVLNQDRQHVTYIALADNNEINAWALNFDMTNSMICVPVAMVHFMGEAEGELGFIIAHEVGHTVDDQCKTQQGRMQAGGSSAGLSAILGGALGGGQGAAAASRAPQQRACEARADEIGFKIFTEAGYSAYAAAGAFGRLEMYMGDTSTGLFARLNALGSDHPMTPDRIKHMRSLLINYAQQNSLTQ